MKQERLVALAIGVDEHFVKHYLTYLAYSTV